MRILIFCIISLSFVVSNTNAKSGTWQSSVAGIINYTSNNATQPRKDYNGKLFTVVYLENLGIDKIGNNTNAEDVQWLRDNGFAVIELDYKKNANATSPRINKDIEAINIALNSGTFCGISNISSKRSYILFEGYRIKTDVAYYKDDPTVYNYPDIYKSTIGDSLYMDIIYPANTKKIVPTLLSFSYSNSWGHKSSASAKGENANMRIYLPYTLAAGFHDTILEGAPGRGIAWAIADHPKYCEWGQGKRTRGANKEYASIATNPDGARKVKSAIRTLRAIGAELGLANEIAIYGFSRGSTTGALAVGDKKMAEFENQGLHPTIAADIQAAVLGPGVFDYCIFADGFTDKNEYKNGTKVWGDINKNRQTWEEQGALYLCETQASAPCLFFYNSTDEKFYGKCADAMKTKLDSLGVDTELIKDFGTDHCVPTSETDLTIIYDFLCSHLSAPTAIEHINAETKKLCNDSKTYDLCGRQLLYHSKKGIRIKNGKKMLVK